MDEDSSQFDSIDYTVFSLMLLASLLIGVYFAYCAKQKQNTVQQYLLGGKSMSVLPIAMSLTSSHISSYLITAIPTEMYIYGTQSISTVLPEFLSTIVLLYIYVPVLYRLNNYSSYEYLRKRFNSTSVKTFGSLVFCIKMMFYIPIAIYLPSVVLAQVTNIDIYIIMVVTSCVCIFYTAVGGLKAVVWSDTLQSSLMYISLITVVIIGTRNAGGFQQVLKKNRETDRLEFFNLNLDPTVRCTFWNTFSTFFLYHISSMSVDHYMVQRCMALETLNKAKLATVLYSLGATSLRVIAVYFGVVLFANFYNCDPIGTKLVSRVDQLVPYFVMKNSIPALPGIFLAGIFGAGLSTVSTGLNSMSAVIYYDFYIPCSKKKMGEDKAALIMKCMTVVLGAVCIVLTIAVDKAGTVTQMFISTVAGTSSVLLGVFTLGILFPWTNAVGALVGGIVGFIVCCWLSIGSQLAVMNKQLVFPTKPFSIEGCDNATLSNFYELANSSVVQDDREPPFFLFKISFNYFSLISLCIVLVVGLVVSFITGANNPQDLNPEHFPPFMETFINKGRSKEMKLLKETKENGNL